MILYPAIDLKDGQAVVQPVYFAAIVVPLLMGQQTDRTLTAGMAAIPVANVAMVIRDAVNGVFLWPYIMESVVVNVAVFKPGQRSPKPANVRVQSSQPMPVDLTEYRQGSAAPTENLAAWRDRANPALRRDPFGSIRLATEVVPEEILAEPEVEVVPLVCNINIPGHLVDINIKRVEQFFEPCAK